MSATEIRLAGEIEQLRQRVARLEKGRQQHTEQNVPNYLTTDATGAVGALFTGGVQLKEGTSNVYAPSNSVAWVDSAGDANEFILGQDTGIARRLNLAAQDPTALPSPSSAALFVAADRGGGSASVGVQLLDRLGNAASGTVLDGLGRSIFARLDGTKLSTVGTATITWPAAGAGSNTLNVKLTGATGTVNAVCSPATTITNPAFFDFGVIFGVPDGAGGVNFNASTNLGAAPGAAGTMTFAFLMWGT